MINSDQRVLHNTIVTSNIIKYIDSNKYYDNKIIINKKKYYGFVFFL